MNPLLVEGLADAIGFVAGSLLGFGAGHLLGWDAFAPGYGNATIAGILLIGVGGGGPSTGAPMATRPGREKELRK